MTSNILLVDDNPIQAATRRMILERSGYSVTVSEDGANALELLPSECDECPYGMVITDHVMPRVSGPELVTELRRREIDIPVLVLSGMPDAESSYDGLNVIFCPKPFPPDALIALTRKILDGPPIARTA